MTQGTAHSSHVGDQKYSRWEVLFQTARSIVNGDEYAHPRSLSPITKVISPSPIAKVGIPTNAIAFGVERMLVIPIERSTDLIATLEVKLSMECQRTPRQAPGRLQLGDRFNNIVQAQHLGICSVA